MCPWRGGSLASIVNVRCPWFLFARDCRRRSLYSDTLRIGDSVDQRGKKEVWSFCCCRRKDGEEGKEKRGRLKKIRRPLITTFFFSLSFSFLFPVSYRSLFWQNGVAERHKFETALRRRVTCTAGGSSNKAGSDSERQTVRASSGVGP